MSSIRRTGGFSLIEILLAIAIITILAAILIPILLAPRARAYDVGAQACLKEIGTNQEALATQAPFEYVPGFDFTTIRVCDQVDVTIVDVTTSTYHYRGRHQSGDNLYEVVPGTPVTAVP